MKKFNLYDGDKQKFIASFDNSEKKNIIVSYESKGYEISEDNDGDLVFFTEDQED